MEVSRHAVAFPLASHLNCTHISSSSTPLPLPTSRVEAAKGAQTTQPLLYILLFARDGDVVLASATPLDAGPSWHP